MTNAQIREYTVGPIYMDNKEKGAHEWVIEFMQYPDEMERFCRILDDELRAINSDYDAKRYYNMVLDTPVIRTVEIGTFEKWLASIGKMGGQHKVPRLSNDRSIVEQILNIIAQNDTNHV